MMASDHSGVRIIAGAALIIITDHVVRWRYDEAR